MSTDTSDVPPPESDHFRKMADAIDHNAGKTGFGGAAVIIPPGGALVKPIELLMLDSSQDPAQFLATIATRIQQMVKELEETARRQMGYM